jgi:DNA-binding MarR family transcriptional regulator
VRELERLERSLAHLAKVDRFTVSQARVLVHVALNPGTSATGIIMATGIRQQAVSACLGVLGMYGMSDGREGLDLVSSKQSEADARVREYRLTDLGEFFMRGLER